MKEVADLMARCWWMYGEGRYEEILKGGMKEIIPEFKTKNDCTLCYSVVVEEIEGDDKVITYEDMVAFMTNESHKYGRAGVTYLDYIQKYGGDGNVLILGNIEPKQGYGISFAAKNKDPTSIGAVIGCVAGVGLMLVGAILTVKTAGVGGVVGIMLVKTGLTLLGVGATTVVVSGAYLTADAVKVLYTKRDVSTIYIGGLKVAQDNCFSGDIGGE